MKNLKKVQGTRYVGGYIGILGSGAVAEVGTGISDENTPLQDLLNGIVSSGGNSVSLSSYSGGNSMGGGPGNGGPGWH